MSHHRPIRTGNILVAAGLSLVACTALQPNATVHQANQTYPMTTLFTVGKADLSGQGKASVKQIAQTLREHPIRTATITGYTDSTGPDSLNAALSEARSNAVKAALVDQGIDASRIQTKGLGPANPVASNATVDGRQKNRRAEISISAP